MYMLEPGYDSWFFVQGEMNTSLFPSGDQSGWQAPSGKVVIWIGSLPSVFFNQIWGIPPFRSDAKAI
jgi:hypothetical protein